jgi:hypothetical protein
VAVYLDGVEIGDRIEARLAMEATESVRRNCLTGIPSVACPSGVRETTDNGAQR